MESGKLKLGDEKRAIQDISNTRRLRRAVEGFKADQAAIDHDKEEEEQLRAQLDDPEAKAVSDRYEKLKAELDDINREGDEARANKNKLVEESNALQGEIEALWGMKKESQRGFKDASDRYWARIKEDQAKKAERLRQQRMAEEERKKLDLVERLREEASSPAYQIEIQDCQTLIDAFSKGTTSEVPVITSAAEQKKADLVGVPQLDIRKVEAPADMVVRKKKGEEEEAYFVSKKGKKSKKGTKADGYNSPALTTPSTSSSHLQIPLPTLTALLMLSIPPPGSRDEIPRVIEDLKTKKAWFEANQELTTKEKVAKAEVEIQRILKNFKKDTHRDAAPADGDGVEVHGDVPVDPTPEPEAPIEWHDETPVGW